MFRNNRQNIEEIYFPCTFDSIFYEKVIKFNMINITKVGPTYFTFKTAPTMHNIYMYSEVIHVQTIFYLLEELYTVQSR